MQYVTEGVIYGAGAYVFKPRGPAEPLVASGPVELTIVRGPLVIEAWQTFTKPCSSQQAFGRSTCGVTQVFRIVKSADEATASYVSTFFSVGPVKPQTDVVIRYTTSLNTAQQFYSDVCTCSYLF
jgi:hypothetical protein